MTFEEYKASVLSLTKTENLPLLSENELEEAYNAEVPIEFAAHVFKVRLSSHSDQ